jgi:hypothetical protein
MTYFRPNRFFLSGRTSRFLLLIFFVFILGISSTYLIWSNSRKLFVEQVSEKAVLIADSLDNSDISELYPDSEVIGTKSYEKLKSRLINARQSINEIRFIYLANIDKNDKIRFLVDSEQPTSVDISKPGDVYSENDKEFIDSFLSTTVHVGTPTTDSFGKWVSVYVPISVFDHTGSRVVMGVDIPSSNYYLSTLLSPVMALVLTSLILAMLILTRRSVQGRDTYLRQKAAFVSASSHDIRSPLVGIKWALESMRDPDTDSSKQNHTLDNIYKSVSAMLSGLESTLSTFSLGHSALEKPKKSFADIRRALVDVAVMHRLDLERKNITVNLVDDKGIEMNAYVDIGQISQAFGHITSLLLDKISDGGALNISMHPVDSDGDYLIKFMTEEKILSDYDVDEIKSHSNFDYKKINPQISTELLGLLFSGRIAIIHGGELTIETGDSTTITLTLRSY